MVDVDVLHVFCGTDGSYGNPVGVVLEGSGVVLSDSQRQAISASTGFSETVFVTSVDNRTIRTFTPMTEIDFAGHAAVGAARYLSIKTGGAVPYLEGRAGRIEAWTEGELTWVRTDLLSTPPWLFERLGSAQEVDQLTGPQDPKQGYTVLWAWIDEASGIIRARTFAPDWGIPEDEANGSGCLKLAATLGRPIEVRHGMGSIIHARPSRPGYGEVGGRVSRQEPLHLTI